MEFYYNGLRLYTFSFLNVKLVACLLDDLVFEMIEQTFEDPRVRSIHVHKLIQPLLPYQGDQNLQSVILRDLWRFLASVEQRLP